MKCYCTASKTDANAIAVNRSWMFIKPCEIPEDTIPSVLELLRQSELCFEGHWSCSARTDNGIDSDETKGSTTRKIDAKQAVIDNGALTGVYLPDDQMVVKVKDYGITNRVDEGYVGGWGDISTYTKIYIRSCK